MTGHYTFWLLWKAKVFCDLSPFKGGHKKNIKAAKLGINERSVQGTWESFATRSYKYYFYYIKHIYRSIKLYGSTI